MAILSHAQVRYRGPGRHEAPTYQSNQWIKTHQRSGIAAQWLAARTSTQTAPRTGESNPPYAAVRASRSRVCDLVFYRSSHANFHHCHSGEFYPLGLPSVDHAGCPEKYDMTRKRLQCSCVYPTLGILHQGRSDSHLDVLLLTS